MFGKPDGPGHPPRPLDIARTARPSVYRAGGPAFASVKGRADDPQRNGGREGRLRIATIVWHQRPNSARGPSSSIPTPGRSCLLPCLGPRCHFATLRPRPPCSAISAPDPEGGPRRRRPAVRASRFIRPSALAHPYCESDVLGQVQTGGVTYGAFRSCAEAVRQMPVSGQFAQFGVALDTARPKCQNTRSISLGE
jgi:hypothetical protein